MKNHLIKALKEIGESLKIWQVSKDSKSFVYISWIEDNHSLFKVGFFNGDIGLYPFPEEFPDYPAALKRFLEISA